MRKFSITVNGQAYEVEVEELGVASAPVAAPVAPVVAPAPVAAPVAAPKPYCRERQRYQGRHREYRRRAGHSELIRLAYG